MQRVYTVPSDTRIESNQPGILIVSQRCIELADECSLFTGKNMMLSIKKRRARHGLSPFLPLSFFLAHVERTALHV